MTRSTPADLAPRDEAARLEAAHAEGHAHVLASWHRTHHAPLMRVALRVVRDPVRAAEIVQDTFARAWQHLPSFRGDARLGAWMARIAQRLALNELRVHRRHASRTTAIDEAADAATPEERARRRGEILEDIADENYGFPDTHIAT